MSDVSQSHEESYVVFRKYQMTIHNESADDCTESDFNNFLIDSPLCNTAVCYICLLRDISGIIDLCLCIKILLLICLEQTGKLFANKKCVIVCTSFLIS